MTVPLGTHRVRNRHLFWNSHYEPLWRIALGPLFLRTTELVPPTEQPSTVTAKNCLNNYEGSISLISAMTRIVWTRRVRFWRVVWVVIVESIVVCGKVSGNGDVFLEPIGNALGS